MPRFRALHVVSELFPYVKTGGLGDVAAALPVALRRIGCDVAVLLPGYPAITRAMTHRRTLWRDDDLFQGGPAELCSVRLQRLGVPAYVLDCPGLFERPGGPYADEDGKDFEDNHRRFAALGFAAARVVERQSGRILVHAHDWQAGLAVAHAKLGLAKPPPCVTTIHNVAYPGTFDRAVFAELGLPAEADSIHGVEFYGGISFLKAGLYYADHITTVSPTYALEIQEPGQGGGLEGLLASRAATLTGILNGVDYAHWSPESDGHLPAPFSADDLSGKRQARIALLERLGLTHRNDAFVMGVVSRLIAQKGIDWLIDSIPWLVEHGVTLVVLGAGDRDLERRLSNDAHCYAEHVRFIRGYDEALSHLIQAGVDSMAIPSRFEPCGLTQLYALRYGSPPIVRRTGGLADTIVDASPEARRSGTATGFVFERADGEGLREATYRALVAHRDRATWERIQRTGMAQDFGWEPAARAYHALYRRLLDGRHAPGGPGAT